MLGALLPNVNQRLSLVQFAVAQVTEDPQMTGVFLAARECFQLGNCLLQFGALVEAAGGSIFGLDEPEAVAGEVVRLMAGGRRQVVEVPPLGLSSQEATAVLAGILDEVASGGQ